MKISAFYVFPAIFLLSTAGYAEQDFYGIQMKNEFWAQNLVLGTGPAADPRDLSQGPVLNHRVHAEASLTSAANERLDFRVNVINGSDSEISSDYRYRDFFIYTKDGRRYSLIDENDDSRLNTIAPGSSKIFSPSLGNLRLQNEEVRMVHCSFDLGRTEIFLFPWSKKEQINQLKSPAPSPEVLATPPPMFSRPAGKTKPSQGEAPRKNFMQWLGFQSPREKPAARPKLVAAVRPLNLIKPLTPAKPAPRNVTAPRTSSSQEDLDRAIKNFVYTPATGNSDSPAPRPSAPIPAKSLPATPATPADEATGNKARVIGYDKANNFVTLNLGFKDGLRQNMMLTILRNGKTVAKAKVKQLRDNVAAAILMPGISQTEVRPGDMISLV